MKNFIVQCFGIWRKKDMKSFGFPQWVAFPCMSIRLCCFDSVLTHCIPYVFLTVIGPSLKPLFCTYFETSVFLWIQICLVQWTHCFIHGYTENHSYSAIFSSVIDFTSLYLGEISNQPAAGSIIVTPLQSRSGFLFFGCVKPTNRGLYSFYPITGDKDP